MFSFLKGKNKEDKPASSPVAEDTGFFSRLKQGLSKTRHQLQDGLATLLYGKKAIDPELYKAIETQLLQADLGPSVTSFVIAELTKAVSRDEAKDSEALMPVLQQILHGILAPVAQPLVLPEQETPFVILMVGINGAGKTTTIGKLAKQFQGAGQSVMLAAGDTFRAAAVEQLQVWGERNDIPVIAQQTGADSASVIFDAMHAATARGVRVLLADTAGRLHTQGHLMAELQKVKRVMSKLDSQAPHEVLLVLDASIGQNALVQAQQFNEAMGVTGLVITKLDGTAKGGIIFAIAQQLNIPIRYIGVGEGIDDLRPFEPDDFIRALFSSYKEA